jgi:hypothetical protein
VQIDRVETGSEVICVCPLPLGSQTHTLTFLQAEIKKNIYPEDSAKQVPNNVN